MAADAPTADQVIASRPETAHSRGMSRRTRFRSAKTGQRREKRYRSIGRSGCSAWASCVNSADVRPGYFIMYTRQNVSCDSCRPLAISVRALSRDVIGSSRLLSGARGRSKRPDCGDGEGSGIGGVALGANLFLGGADSGNPEHLLELGPDDEDPI